MFICLLFFAEKNVKGDVRLGIGEWPDPIRSDQSHREGCVLSDAGAACPSASLNHWKPQEVLATSRGLSDPDTQSLTLGIPVILMLAHIMAREIQGKSVQPTLFILTCS